MKKKPVQALLVIFLVVAIASTLLPLNASASTSVYYTETETDANYILGSRLDLFSSITLDQYVDNIEFDIASTNMQIDNVTYDIALSVGNGTYTYANSKYDIDDDGDIVTSFNTELGVTDWKNEYGLGNKYVTLETDQDDSANDDNVINIFSLDIPDVEITDNLNITFWYKFQEDNGVGCGFIIYPYTGVLGSGSSLGNQWSVTTNQTAWTRVSLDSSETFVSANTGDIISYLRIHFEADGLGSGSAYGGQIDIAGFVINGQPINFEEDFKINGYNDAGAESVAGSMKGLSDGVEDDVIILNTSRTMPYTPSIAMSDYISGTLSIKYVATMRLKEIDARPQARFPSGMIYTNMFNIPDFDEAEYALVNITYSGIEPVTVKSGEGTYAAVNLYFTNVLIDPEQVSASWTELVGTWNGTSNKWDVTSTGVSFTEDEQYLALQIRTEEVCYNAFIWAWSFLIFVTQGNLYLFIGLVAVAGILIFGFIDSAQSKRSKNRRYSRGRRAYRRVRYGNERGYRSYRKKYRRGMIPKGYGMYRAYTGRKRRRRY
jgi:hypothetical protein